MKLRIKETGELLEDVKFIDTTLNKITIQYLDDGILRECIIKNLSDIEEVKDYEGPEEYWFISDLDVKPMKCELRYCPVRDFTEWSETRKRIGNYFETKEEAEKAVEKLKAWKRLEDKGFRFDGWNKRYCDEINYCLDTTEDMSKDLDLLFSGEGGEE